jgi:hypothetical protein
MRYLAGIEIHQACPNQQPQGLTLGWRTAGAQAVGGARHRRRSVREAIAAGPSYGWAQS